MPTVDDVAPAGTAEIADPSVNTPPVITDTSAAKEATDDDARSQALAAYEESSLLLLRPAALPTDLAVDLVS